MSIYETSVRKPVTTALIFIGVVFFGLFSYNKLAVDLFPEIEAPYISVITFYSGAGAEDIENNVTKLLEDQLNSVNNLKKLTSTSKDNVSIIMMEFEWGIHLDEATSSIRDLIGRVERSLPESVEKPIVFKFNTNMMPILFLSATAQESFPALNKILEDVICSPLNRIDGIGAVSVSGGPTREVQINVDPKKIEAYNISVEQIGAVIAQENLNMPSGSVDVGNSTYALRVEGEFDASEKIRNIVVSNYQGKPVYLRDIATVSDTTKELSQFVTTNGLPSARITVTKQSGANTVEICRDIYKMLPDLVQNLPPDVELKVTSDSSETVLKSINSLTETVFWAALFVIITTLLFLGKWRSTTIIIITIPISLICAFIYLFLTGNTLNIISLSSLSICIGLVTDDAIVILENIIRHLKRGSSPREAAIYATNEVGVAVIATTLTLLAVFLPLTFLTGIAGIMFKQLGWIVAIVTTVSTVAGLSLTPMMASLMLKSKEDEKENTKSWSYRLYRPIELALEGLDNAYARLLAWAISHRGLVLTVAILSFLSSLLLLNKVGTEFFPQSDDSELTITIELPMGVRKEYTRDICESFQQTFAEKYPEMVNYTLTVGSADENNLFGSFSRTGSNIGRFSVRLLDQKDRERSAFEIADELRNDLAQIPDIDKYSVSTGGGFSIGSGSDLEIKIFGHDIDQTTLVANELVSRMEKVKGTRDIKSSREEMKPEFRLDLDREKLAIYGLNTRTVAAAVRNRINGMVASKYREEGNEYEIVVRYDRPFRESVDAIENIVVYNNQGNGVKIKELGRVQENYTLPEITRENRQRVVTVSASVYGEALGHVVRDVNAELRQIDIPQGVYTSIGGAAADQAESFSDMLTLLVLIVGLVFIVMASQFESLRMPFIIIISVFFAFTGVFLALFLTGTNLSVIALIGAVMLVGIVVKNGIVLVDFTNLQRDRGLSLSQAVITGGHSRLRPVLMTTITTILAMVPLAIGIGEGSELWRPMGIAIIGGLTFSTLLTMIVVPVLYSMFGAQRMKSERRRLAKLHEAIGG